MARSAPAEPTGVKILACDPALRNWGLAKVVVNPLAGELAVLDLKLVKTESEAGKTVRKSSDDLRRATVAYKEVVEWVEWADLIAAEVPSGSKSARATLGAGISIGLLACFGQMRPLVQVNPIEVKKIVTGRKTAAKDEVIEWAVARFPKAPWLRERDKPTGRLVDANEHLADAVAIAHAAIATPEFGAAVAMQQSFARGVALQGARC